MSDEYLRWCMHDFAPSEQASSANNLAVFQVHDPCSSATHAPLLPWPNSPFSSWLIVRDEVNNTPDFELAPYRYLLSWSPTVLPCKSLHCLAVHGHAVQLPIGIHPMARNTQVCMPSTRSPAVRSDTHSTRIQSPFSRSELIRACRAASVPTISRNEGDSKWQKLFCK